jgi:chlorite dismutase
MAIKFVCLMSLSVTYRWRELGDERRKFVMVTINKRLAAFVLWFAVVAFASPSFAQQSENHMSDAREKPFTRATSGPPSKQYTWGVTEVTTYRTCMAEHGQQE